MTSKKKLAEKLDDKKRKKQLREMRRALTVYRSGDPRATAANIAAILRLHPDWLGVLVYDAFAHTVRTTRAPEWHELDAP